MKRKTLAQDRSHSGPFSFWFFFSKLTLMCKGCRGILLKNKIKNGTAINHLV